MVKFSKSGPLTADELTIKQVAFVREYVERAGRPAAGPDAAIAAGFALPPPASRHTARQRAYELLHDQFILKAIREELTRRLNAGAALGVQTLIDLAQSGRSEQVRLQAANSLIDRGFGPVMSRNATIVARTTIEDLLKQIDAKDTAFAVERGGGPLEIEHEPVTAQPPNDES